MEFSTNYQDIIAQIDNVDPIEYGRTRNYLHGTVTKLSPYISRGVISTKQVANLVLAKGYQPYAIEIFLKELAWRDYFQQVWVAKGNEIDEDIKQAQTNCTNSLLPVSILHAKTGIDAMDTGIQSLLQTGYLHNHMRMYVASIVCNVAKSHWAMPAKWMYYYLLDADWASNALSWQWVAGSFSNKKYVANQENINKYTASQQRNTFLDLPYERFDQLATPKELMALISFDAETTLPVQQAIVFDKLLPTYLYTFYSIDCTWDADIEANRVLLLEPSFFKKYPVCDKSISFVLHLAKNIQNIQIFIGEFDDLEKELSASPIHFKEHPTNQHFKGIIHKREWMFEQVEGYYPSFSACSKESGCLSK